MGRPIQWATAFGAALFLAPASALAAERIFACKVHCLGPKGQIEIELRAKDLKSAVKEADREADDMCRSRGHNRATSSSMSVKQCK